MGRAIATFEGAAPIVNAGTPPFEGRVLAAPNGDDAAPAVLAGVPKLKPAVEFELGSPALLVAGEAGWLLPKANGFDVAVALVGVDTPNENPPDGAG